MPGYDGSSFHPPAPVVRASVRGRAGRRNDLLLLVDTGADVTVLPRAAALAVDAEIRDSHVPLRFYDGSLATFEAAEIDLDVLSYRFHGMYVIADAEYGLLGRDILNLLVVRLDGPEQVWSA